MSFPIYKHRKPLTGDQILITAIFFPCFSEITTLDIMLRTCHPFLKVLLLFSLLKTTPSSNSRYLLPTRGQENDLLTLSCPYYKKPFLLTTFSNRYLYQLKFFSQSLFYLLCKLHLPQNSSSSRRFYAYLLTSHW